MEVIGGSKVHEFEQHSQHHVQGLGVHQSSDIIMFENENKLFQSGVLGEDTQLKSLRL